MVDFEQQGFPTGTPTGLGWVGPTDVAEPHAPGLTVKYTWAVGRAQGMGPLCRPRATCILYILILLRELEG